MRVACILALALLACDVRSVDLPPARRDQSADTGAAVCTDADQDGHAGGCPGATDCDDNDPLRHPDAPDGCDGIDNDCDRRIDEDDDVGQRCDATVGDCTAPGEIVCDDAGLPRCVAFALDPCDGRDDDCDGRIDEADRDVDSPCAAEGAVGGCAAGALTCTAGTLICGPGTPAAERCNAIDDDCDGRVDEGADGRPLQTACRPDVPPIGACNPGTFTCTGEAEALWGPCEGFVGPRTEACDGLDNDCDGATDELAGGCACLRDAPDDGCYSGPPDTLGVGLCAAGPPRTCLYDSDRDGWIWSACEDVTPTLEACDGADNDCDGAVDEALPLGEACTAGTGVCARAGRVACVEGVAACDAAPGEGAPERCNGLDDDCDGRVDETNARPCAAGQGACRREGVEICDGDRMAWICSVTPRAPVDERCDDVDNDCDGAIDEDLNLGAACETGVGACSRSGRLGCGPNANVICLPRPGDPTPEVCDAIDNDCDGATDEGLGLDQPCDGIGACGPGLLECSSAHQVRCSSDAFGSADGRTSERCDAIDNDCDGAVDERWPLGDACMGACGAGVIECAERGARCSTDAGGSAFAPAAEICGTGADEDCDMVVDEGCR